MRTLLAVLVLAMAAVAGGCTCRRQCTPRGAGQELMVACAPQQDPISTTTTPYTFFNDGHSGTIVTRRENVYGPDAATYDVRDLDELQGAVEVVFLKLPDLAREQGATYAELGDGALRIVGPPQAHALVKEVLAMLRASPGPRPCVGATSESARAGGVAARSAPCPTPDQVVGAWRMDWFAYQGTEDFDPQLAAKLDATPMRWLVLTADGKGALVSADGVTVLADAMFKSTPLPAEPGRHPPAYPAPVEPPIEFIWWRVRERYLARIVALHSSEPVEATLSGDRLITTQDTFEWVLKRDRCPPAGVERRLRGELSPVTATPPRFWDFLK
jgi:hypothetical protein